MGSDVMIIRLMDICEGCGKAIYGGRYCAYCKP